MGFWSKLFRKKEPEQQMMNDNIDPYGFINIHRNDGTILKIRANADKDGNQQYQNIIDQRTGEQLAIPEYSIMVIQKNGQFKIEKILMELPPQALQYPQYTYWIANEMLSQQNMGRVLNEQYGYVGGVQTRDGQIARTACRPGIIETLKIEKERHMDEKRRMEFRGGMTQDAFDNFMESQPEINYKTSHAVDLSKVNNPYNNRNSGQDMGR